MVTSIIDLYPGLKAKCHRKVVAIQPFLQAKVQRGDRALEKRLVAMGAGYVPNNEKWCNHFKTVAPYLETNMDKVVDGVRVTFGGETAEPQASVFADITPDDQHVA